MPEPGSLTYDVAREYVATWAAAVHEDLHALKATSAEFFGLIGTLNFTFLRQEGILRVWGLVQMSAGPLLGERQEIKAELDRIAREQPEEVAGGTFDVRSLPWIFILLPRWSRVSIFGWILIVHWRVLKKLSII